MTGQRPLRLAYFSPLPPAPTGIADYSWQLLPYLAQFAEITLFVPDPAKITMAGHHFPVRAQADFGQLRLAYDLPLYQLGNSLHHEFVYRQALRYPGVVVLHDYYLGHLLATISGEDKSYGAYVRDLGYVLGPPGVDLAWSIRYGRRPYPLFSLPLNDRLVDHSLGLIVHSETAAGSLRRQQQRRPAQRRRPVGIIPQLMTPNAGHSQRDLLPPAMEVTPDTVIFASVGQVTPGKRLDLALRAFARLRATLPQSRYLIVGQQSGGANLEELISELGLTQFVHLTGYVSGLQAFADWISTADIIVNLRQPTLGETSAAVLRAMAAGRPAIVFDQGWYSELPRDCCRHVPLHDEDALVEAMLSLAEDPQARKQMGRQAVDYVKRELNPQECAARYAAFIEGLLASLDNKFLDLEAPERSGANTD